MDTIANLFWSILPSILVGILMAFWNRGQKRRDDQNERREQDRKNSELLRINLLVATAKLSYAVAMAMKRGAPNGEVEEGIAEYDKAMKEFRLFEREQIANKSLD